MLRLTFCLIVHLSPKLNYVTSALVKIYLSLIGHYSFRRKLLLWVQLILEVKGLDIFLFVSIFSFRYILLIECALSCQIAHLGCVENEIFSQVVFILN